MWLGVVTTLLTANPTLAAPGFQCSGFESTLCDGYLEHFVGRVSDRGLAVTTKNDLAQLLGLERQRQLLGCAEESASCVAELVGALGVGKLLSGTISKTESGYLATLKVIDVATGATQWNATEPLESERGLYAFFDRSAASLVDKVAPRPTGAGLARWIPAMVGAGVVLAGAIAFGFSEGDAGRLRAYANAPESSSWTLTDIRAAGATGRLGQIIGVGCSIVGGLGIGASLLWVLLAPSSTAKVAFVPNATGANASVWWELP